VVMFQKRKTRGFLHYVSDAPILKTIFILLRSSLYSNETYTLFLYHEIMCLAEYRFPGIISISIIVHIISIVAYKFLG
jgi:hypothetical protein